MPVKRCNREEGFTMIVTVLGTALVMLLALVAVAAVNGDSGSTVRDLQQKRAYEAAKAGIENYVFHLNHDTGYWAKCTEVPTPNAINQIGSTAKRRPVPGDTGAEYAIELIPAEGQSECNPVNATTTMIETREPMAGTFRIRSTGFAGPAKTSITATFKSASFLDFVYFTQLETLDPSTYGFAEGSEQLQGVNTQCSKTYEEGRNSKPYWGSKYCLKIDFVTKDVLNGPVHTNDTMSICGKPTFGRNAQDRVQIGAKYPGWFNNSCESSSAPQYLGTPETGSPELKPPSTDKQLKEIAEPQFKFEGQVRICLNGNTITIGKGKSCRENVVYPSGPLPANGVIYVGNSKTESCPAGYSPFTAKYLDTSPCGNAYVHSEPSYSGRLTIAAENDIIIDGSICWASAECNAKAPNGTEMLGLIANNFVRVYHDYPSEVINPQTANPECGTLGAGQTEKTISNIMIDAAILSLNHSFIVDHYNCGQSIGTVTIHGAVAQKFRGPVGEGSHGYQGKSYNYDDRLKYLEPPSFIQPEKLPWLIGRETVG